MESKKKMCVEGQLHHRSMKIRKEEINLWKQLSFCVPSKINDSLQLCNNRWYMLVLLNREDLQSEGMNLFYVNKFGTILSNAWFTCSAMWLLIGVWGTHEGSRKEIRIFQELLWSKCKYDLQHKLQLHLQQLKLHRWNTTIICLIVPWKRSWISYHVLVPVQGFNKTPSSLKYMKPNMSWNTSVTGSWKFEFVMVSKRKMYLHAKS